eukprot:PhM_4_TR18672/c0_g1_i2/m.71157
MPEFDIFFVQGASALVFSSFAIPHFINLSLGVAGEKTYNRVQKVLRKFYQNPIVEGTLVASIITHVGAGILRRTRYPTPIHLAPLRTRAHVYSAYFLATVILGHIIGARTHGNLDFGGLSYLLQKYPKVTLTYFITHGLMGVTHILLGFPQALALVGIDPPIYSVPAWGIGAAVGTLTLGVLGMAGKLFTLPDYADHPTAKHIQDMIAKKRAAREAKKQKKVE